MKKERKVAYLQTRIEQLESELAEARADADRLREQLSRESAANKQERNDRDRTQSVLSAMMAQYAEMIKSASEAKNTYVKAVADLRILKADFDKEMKKELGRLRKQNKG